MNTNSKKTKWMIYKELELIPDSIKESKPHRLLFLLWFGQIWKFLVDVLTSGSEPRIWERHDRTGKPYWYIYDPATHESVHCFSQAEIRTWLENRYNSRKITNRNIPSAHDWNHTSFWRW